MADAVTSMRSANPPTAESSDPWNTIVEGLQRGDPDCFKSIIEHYQQDIATFCVRYVGSSDVARDLTQEVFLTLWRERKRYRHCGKLKSYLLGIARYRCLAHLKVARKLIAFRPEGDKRSSSPDPELLGHDLRGAINKLHPHFAEVLILRYLEDMDLKEIAQLTEQPLGTVKSRLHRALKLLRSDWHA